MSEYFRVLNRLAEQGTTRPAIDRVRPPVAVEPAVERRPVAESLERHAKLEPVAKIPLPAQPTEVVAPAQEALAEIPEDTRKPVAPIANRAIPAALQELLDTVQRIRQNGATRSLVISSVSGYEDASALAIRVARIFRERGLPIRAARLSEVAGGPGELIELPISTTHSDWSQRLSEWRSTQAGDGVSLIVAPAMSGSSEAAALAQNCDGLVLLVELGRTTRQALAQAVKRAESAGCTLLGTIVVGSEQLPGWARRFWRSLR